MPQNYTIVELPGKTRLKIATTDVARVGKEGEELTEVKSPEWMIKMDDLLESDVEDFNDYAELFGWHAESSRFTTGDISNSLFTSATLRHSDLTVLIPNGGFSAKLESKMNLGDPIQELTIVRLGNIRATKVKLQTVVYTICRIQSFQQQLDRLFLQMTVTTKENTIFVFDIDGQNKGQVVSRVDYSRNIAE